MQFRLGLGDLKARLIFKEGGHQIVKEISTAERSHGYKPEVGFWAVLKLSETDNLDFRDLGIEPLLTNEIIVLRNVGENDVFLYRMSDVDPRINTDDGVDIDWRRVITNFYPLPMKFQNAIKPRA
jgi:hypothetical protein